MEPTINEIRSIVQWIIEHPNHFNEQESKRPIIGLPIEIWYRFLDNPKIINEYENPRKYEMRYNPVVNGCTHIFSHGKRQGSLCNVPVLVTTNKCYFHDVIVFSESLRTYIKRLNATVDSYWK